MLSQKSFSLARPYPEDTASENRGHHLVRECLHAHDPLFFGSLMQAPPLSRLSHFCLGRTGQEHLTCAACTGPSGLDQIRHLPLKVLYQGAHEARGALEASADVSRPEAPLLSWSSAEEIQSLLYVGGLVRVL